MKTLKENIISLLKKEGELSSTKISELLEIHYYLVLPALFDLESLGKIEKRIRRKYTFWRITE